jgi:hypothetical protein
MGPVSQARSPRSDKYHNIETRTLPLCPLLVQSNQYFCSRLSKKTHSLLSSIRRIVQTRGHSCANPTVRPPFGSRLTLIALYADAHPPGYQR